MRAELFYSPTLLLERFGEFATTKRRLSRLRGTVAKGLLDGHIDLLELLDLIGPLRPRAIFDIGANIGTSTLLLEAIFPGVSIYAFEPLAQHVEKFVDLTAGLSNVKLLSCALGATNQTKTMHVASASDCSSFLAVAHSKRDHRGMKQISDADIEQRRLDDVISAESLPWADVMKLDVQGYELEVLRGAEEALEHVSAIIAEVSFRDLYEGQCRFDELVTFLARRGLFVYAFGKRTRVGKPLEQADVLFMRPCRNSSDAEFTDR